MRTGARAGVFAPPYHLPAGCRLSEEGGMALGGTIPGKFPSAEGAGLPARGVTWASQPQPQWGRDCQKEDGSKGAATAMKNPSVLYRLSCNLGTPVLGAERSVRVQEHGAHVREPPSCQGGCETARSGATEPLGRPQSPASAASSRVTSGNLLHLSETGFP